MLYIFAIFNYYKKARSLLLEWRTVWCSRKQMLYWTEKGLAYCRPCQCQIKRFYSVDVFLSFCQFEMTFIEIQFVRESHRQKKLENIKPDLGLVLRNTYSAVIS
jgi:hypothetical protein